ncbi:MAG: V-type ATPase subunit [Candidatus Hadarchaeales archaeon]
MIETAVILVAVIFGLLGIVFYFSKKTTEYVFVNSAVSAWESKLLPESKLMELADAPDMKAVLSALSESEYGRFLEKGEDTDIEKIEVGLHLHLAGKFRGLLEMVPGDRRRTVELLLWRTDLVNLKSIVTMISLGVPKEERKKQLLPSLTPPERLELLSSATTIEELMEFLKDSWFSEAFSGGGEILEPGAVLRILDKNYYSLLWKEVVSKKSQRKVLMRAAGYLIDSVNAMTILRLKREGIQPQEIENYLIKPSFELTEEMIKAMLASETIQDAIHMIHITSVGKALKEVAEEIEKGGVEVAEIALEKGYLKLCRGLAMAEFFSIAPVLAYIALKENEVRNLRVIMRMKADGIKPEEIKGEIVGVPKVEL